MDYSNNNPKVLLLQFLPLRLRNTLIRSTNLQNNETRDKRLGFLEELE